MNWLLLCFWSAFFVAPIASQGVVLRKKATVYYGEPSTCSRPATINFATLKETTDEWKRIKSEGIKEGSAVYTILMNQITTKIKNAVKDYCKNEAFDMACEEGHIKEDNGFQITDITDYVLPNLIVFSRSFEDFTYKSLHDVWPGDPFAQDFASPF